MFLLAPAVLALVMSSCGGRTRGPLNRIGQVEALPVQVAGRRLAVRLEGGPYRTRYDAVALSSAQFARLYEDRDWRRLQCTASWKF